MRVISVKELIEFNAYSTKRKENFAHKLRVSGLVQEEILDTTGGDYWNRSISAISNTFKTNNPQYILQKIQDITADKQGTSVKRTIVQYDANLHNLYNYADFDVADFCTEKIEIIEKVRKSGVILISDFFIKIKVHQIFQFEKNGVSMIGAILFVANKEGFSTKQLGLYAEAAFNFLKLNFSDKYTVSADNVSVVDVYSTASVTYNQILDGRIPSQLNSTLLEIKNLFNK